MLERSLLEDVAMVFLVASVATIIFQRLRQPAVLGYLLAGLVVGPNVPIPLFANLERIEQLSEIGVILVIFSIGLHFRFARLRSILPTSGVAALVQIPAMLWLGYVVGQVAGWGDLESLFLGGVVCISSTMIVARVLPSGGDPRVAEHAYGILIVQDIAAIVLIAIFTAVAGGASVPASAVARLVGELALFLALAAVGGILIVPWLIRESDHRGSSEVLLVTAIGTCCGLALIAEHLGFSVALGAFIAGSVIAESGRSKRVERLVEPVRDLFAGVFFVSIGMLVDPRAIADNWVMIATVSATVVIGQIFFITAGSLLSGRSVGVSVRAALAMAQVGEFSFIIVGVGVSAGAVPPRLLAVAVGVAVATTFLTPLLVRASDRAAAGFERRLPRSLQTFVALYGAWLESLRARKRRGRSPIRRHVILLVIDAVVIGGVIVAAAELRERYAIAALVAPLVALPFVVSFARNVRLLGRSLAEDVLPATAADKLDLADAPRRALIVGLELLISALAIAPLMALSAPFLPAYAVAGVALAVFLGLGVLFWRRARNLWGHVEASANVVLEWLERQRSDADEVDIGRALPGLGPLVPHEIAAASPAVDRTLAELNLRARTGATVLALRRAGGGGVGTPAGHERIAAGDVLTLSGTSAAIAAARRLLDGASEDPEPL